MLGVDPTSSAPSSSLIHVLHDPLMVADSCHGISAESRHWRILKVQSPKSRQITQPSSRLLGVEPSGILGTSWQAAFVLQPPTPTPASPQPSDGLPVSPSVDPAASAKCSAAMEGRCASKSITRTNLRGKKSMVGVVRFAKWLA